MSGQTRPRNDASLYEFANALREFLGLDPLYHDGRWISAVTDEARATSSRRLRDARRERREARA